MDLNLDELWEVLYAVEDKIYRIEDDAVSDGNDKNKAEYLKRIAKKIEYKIEKWEA